MSPEEILRREAKKKAKEEEKVRTAYKCQCIHNVHNDFSKFVDANSVVLPMLRLDLVFSLMCLQCWPRIVWHASTVSHGHTRPRKPPRLPRRRPRSRPRRLPRPLPPPRPLPQARFRITRNDSAMTKSKIVNRHSFLTRKSRYDRASDMRAISDKMRITVCSFTRPHYFFFIFLLSSASAAASSSQPTAMRKRKRRAVLLRTAATTRKKRFTSTRRPKAPRRTCRAR